MPKKLESEGSVTPKFMKVRSAFERSISPEKYYAWYTSGVYKKSFGFVTKDGSKKANTESHLDPQAMFWRSQKDAEDFCSRMLEMSSSRNAGDRYEIVSLTELENRFLESKKRQ